MGLERPQKGVRTAHINPLLEALNCFFVHLFLLVTHAGDEIGKRHRRSNFEVGKRLSHTLVKHPTVFLSGNFQYERHTGVHEGRHWVSRLSLWTSLSASLNRPRDAKAMA